MDTSSNPGSPTTAELAAQVESLRTQVKVAHFLSLALAVGVGLLLFRMDQFQSKVVESQMAASQRLLEDQVRMNKAVIELQKYAATHPDYAPILKKYGVEPSAGTNAAAAR